MCQLQVAAACELLPDFSVVFRAGKISSPWLVTVNTTKRPRDIFLYFFLKSVHQEKKDTIL